MHTYRKSKREEIWTVGYFEPRSDSEGHLFYEWYPLTDFGRETEAIARVNHLNGGNNHVDCYIMEP